VDRTNVANAIKTALKEMNSMKTTSSTGANKENLKRRNVQLLSKAKELVQKTSSASRFRVS
jgi:hypothetical protein